MKTPSISPRKIQWKKVLQVVIGCSMAGVLMGEREAFDESWQRALMAAAASICIVLVGQNLRQGRSSHTSA